MTKTKKKLLGLVFTVLVVLLIGALSAPKLADIYRDISFYWEERTEAELKVKKYSEEMGISYSEYPESLIELLERNPETESFVLHYPFREEQQIDLSGHDLTQGVPLLMQWDERWGYTRYGSDVVGITGCGPVCLSMAGYYVTGGDEAFTPDKIIEFSAKNGYYESGYGTSWTLISEGGVKLGLDVTEIPLVKQRIIDNLEVGNPIICSMRAGDFTTTGHYIVLVGWEDGMIRVNDPNSHENSEKLWSYEQIEGQIRNLWVIRD